MSRPVLVAFCVKVAGTVKTTMPISVSAGGRCPRGAW